MWSLLLLVACARPIPLWTHDDDGWHRSDGEASTGWWQESYRFRTPPLPDEGWIAAHRDGGHLRLPVQVSSDTAPMYFVLDTGADQLSLTDAGAASLGLPPEAAIVLDGDVRGFAGAQPTRMIQFDRLAIGPLVARPSWPMYQLDLSSIPDVHGLLGSPMWTQSVLWFDITGERVRFTPDATELEGLDPQWVPMLGDGRTPRLTVHIDGRPFTAHIDTGAGGVSLSSEVVEALGLARRKVTTTRGVGGSQPSYRVDCPRWLQVGTLSLEPTRCREEQAHTTDPPDINLGTDVLRDVVLLVDLPNRRVGLAPMGTGPVQHGATPTPPRPAAD